MAAITGRRLGDHIHEPVLLQPGQTQAIIAAIVIRELAFDHFIFEPADPAYPGIEGHAVKITGPQPALSKSQGPGMVSYPPAQCGDYGICAELQFSLHSSPE